MMATLKSKNTAGTVKAYVARITGKSAKFGLEREFLGRIVEDAATGLYEVCDSTRKGKDVRYYYVYEGQVSCALGDTWGPRVAQWIDNGKSIVLAEDSDGDLIPTVVDDRTALIAAARAALHALTPEEREELLAGYVRLPT